MSTVSPAPFGVDPMNLLQLTLRRLDGWAVASQQQARRNAMIASTRLAQRRAERNEVEEFLALLAARKEQAVTPGEPSAPAAHA